MSIVDQLPALGNWLAGDDVGTSSRTMVAIALGATEGDFDAPHDPSDFGRCYRLVKAVPAIRESFLTISMRVPAFLRILHNWDELRSEEHTSELQSLMRISYAVFCLIKTNN